MPIFELLRSVTGGRFAAVYSNDELGLSLNDLFFASNDMIAHGELSDAEAAAIRPLDDALTAMSVKRNASFWQREALCEDECWNGIRTIAASALARLPEEARPVGRFAENFR